MEKIALGLFEKGEPEKFSLIVENGKSIYRYMAPLFVEEGCMACHAKQGYKIGDVRGGISVSFDVTDLRKQIVVNRFVFVGLSVAVSLFLLATIFILVLRVAKKLSDAYSTIEKMSITDELTQLCNRRFFHAQLDEEIQRVARYGGEEIVAILPETDEKGAYAAAENIRKILENHQFNIPDGKKIRVTASFGGSSLNMLAEDIPDKSRQIITLADDALYTAKESGRNKVVLFSEY